MTVHDVNEKEALADRIDHSISNAIVFSRWLQCGTVSYWHHGTTFCAAVYLALQLALQ
jgi:hypothetical protein